MLHAVLKRSVIAPLPLPTGVTSASQAFHFVPKFRTDQTYQSERMLSDVCPHTPVRVRGIEISLSKSKRRPSAVIVKHSAMKRLRSASGPVIFKLFSHQLGMAITPLVAV